MAWWNNKGGLELTAALFQKVVDDFNAEHPELCVTQTYGMGSWEEIYVKLTAAFSAGIGPDICSPNEIVLSLGHAGLLMNHRPWLEVMGWDDVFTDAAIAPMSRAYTPGRELYGVPQWLACSRLMFFSHHYEETGLDPNKPPDNYDEVLEYAEKLTVRENGKVKRAGFNNYSGAASYWYGVIQCVWGHGADIVAQDNPYEAMVGSSEFAAALQWYGDTDQKWHVSFEKGSSALGDVLAQELVSQFYGHNSKLPRLPKELQPKLEVAGVALAPRCRVAPITVEGQCVNALSKHMGATLEFFAGIMGTEFLGAYNELYAKEPTRYDLLDLPHLQDRRHQAWLKAAEEYGRPRHGWHPEECVPPEEGSSTYSVSVYRLRAPSLLLQMTGAQE